MCFNGGEFDGVCIFGCKMLELMMQNYLFGGGDLVGMLISMFSEVVNVGIGFGFGFVINIDFVKLMIVGLKGEYYWGGMFLIVFFIDLVECVMMVFMMQVLFSSFYLICCELKMMIYVVMM